MRIADSFVDELNAEANTTRRVLERVPEAHLRWQPHQKSMSLGQLALHVATLPQLVTGFAAADTLDFASAYTGVSSPTSRADLMNAFEGSLEAARAYLTSLDDARAGQIWRLLADGTELLAVPRAAVIRSFLLNHLYHHSGQLLVYLRLLDVPVPSVYGPTADENPFAAVRQS